MPDFDASPASAPAALVPTWIVYLYLADPNAPDAQAKLEALRLAMACHPRCGTEFSSKIAPDADGRYRLETFPDSPNEQRRKLDELIARDHLSPVRRRARRSVDSDFRWID